MIDDFLRLHRFPGGYSLKVGGQPFVLLTDGQLNYYRLRSIVWSLLMPSGYRKQQSVFEVLNAFSGSQFIFFGDSGEHDLELYLSLAIQRPHQVIAIFIRDITVETMARTGFLSNGEFRLFASHS